MNKSKPHCRRTNYQTLNLSSTLNTMSQTKDKRKPNDIEPLKQFTMHYKNLVKSFEEIDRNYTIDLERNIPDKTFGLDDSFDMSRESIENINLKIESYENKEEANPSVPKFIDSPMIEKQSKIKQKYKRFKQIDLPNEDKLEELKILQPFQILNRWNKVKKWDFFQEIIIREYDKGQTIATQGDSSEHFYMIISGRVKITCLVEVQSIARIPLECK